MVSKRFSVECSQFKHYATRLDDFYFDVLSLQTKSEFQKPFPTFLLLFTLSHGQASVERGFSVNNDMLVINLKKDSLVALCLVQDYLS